MDNKELETDVKIALLKLEKEMDEIAGAWSGDDAGIAEDRAHQANDVVAAINELWMRLNELKEM